MFTSEIKNSQQWEEAEMLYSELRADLMMPSMLSIGNSSLSPEEIINRLTEMIEVCEAFYPAYMERGSRNLLHDFERGKQDFDTGFQLFLQVADANNMEEEFDSFVDMFEDLWRWDLLAKYGKEMINYDPSNPFYYDITSHALSLLNYKEEAIEFGQKAVDMEPDNKYYTNNLGFSYMMYNQLDKAAEMFQRSLQSDPDHKHAINNLDECNFLRKHNLSFEVYYFSKPDHETIKGLLDKGHWEDAKALITRYNFQRTLMLQLYTAPYYIYKEYPHAKYYSTLKSFFRFVSSIDYSYHLYEDIEFYNEYFESIMNKFIIKHSDVDETMLTEIFEGLLLFYGFLTEHEVIEEQKYYEFKETTSKLREDIFDKMHKYNEIRHDETISDEKKETIREELFGNDHLDPVL